MIGVAARLFTVPLSVPEVCCVHGVVNAFFFLQLLRRRAKADPKEDDE
jgi:hypothetical protein